MPHRVIVAAAPDAETFLLELELWELEARVDAELAEDDVGLAELDRPAFVRAPAHARRIIRGLNAALIPPALVANCRPRSTRTRRRTRGRSRARARSPGRRTCSDDPELEHVARAAGRCV